MSWRSSCPSLRLRRLLLYFPPRPSTRRTSNDLSSAHKNIMRSLAIVAVLSGALAVLAAPSGPVVDICGTHVDPTEASALEAKFAASKKTIASRAPFPGVVIPVYWHVINAGPDVSDGNIRDCEIVANINVMNNDYAGSGIQFSIKNITRTTNAKWFHSVDQGTTYETAMKRTLRVGGADTLNIYTVAFDEIENPGLLGYATFPMYYEDAPQDDGVVISHLTLPGGALPRYNGGRTLTHETGHWLGLYHTFQGGCDGPGDFVDDTPAEASAFSGCMKGRDSCPQDPGLDPISNYMDYSDDACMNQFTPGQWDRIAAAMSLFRGAGATDS
ncbi:hypothetical protein BOTBODRAFT_593121 [Botryobasidium botryosum FD-172 SS1]|uniref:Peptidase M43 pregnancy-associated plasma-A domain-containing protein n=1 Tax=Botryobasidium botryosum (strain FD-172 SS1) TaxID=930990 RepID=A0A067LWJ5_BOTB1|nr:hypothetical protein BOTBODRAFT_593121 [Botryobasidium botryosum FD-172 SS1]